MKVYSIFYSKHRLNYFCRSGGISYYSESKVCKLVVASIVLHNICIQKGIPLSPEDDHHLDFEVIPGLQEDERGNLPQRQQNQLAKDIRRTVAEGLH